MGGGRCRPRAVGEGPRAAVAAVAVAAAAAGRGHNRKSRREPPGPAPRGAPPRSGWTRPPPGALCAAPGPVRRATRAVRAVRATERRARLEHPRRLRVLSLRSALVTARRTALEAGPSLSQGRRRHLDSPSSYYGNDSCGSADAIPS